MVLSVKAQRSQFPYGKEMMIYTESRSFWRSSAMTDEWKKLFDEHGEKFFCEVEWEPGSPARFVKEIERQEW